jgi:hypothetical protein
LARKVEVFPVFSCSQCGSRYSAAYAAAIEDCPRCQARDGIASPLTFSLFERRDVALADAMPGEEPEPDAAPDTLRGPLQRVALAPAADRDGSEVQA